MGSFATYQAKTFQLINRKCVHLILWDLPVVKHCCNWLDRVVPQINMKSMHKTFLYIPYIFKEVTNRLGKSTSLNPHWLKWLTQFRSRTRFLGWHWDKIKFRVLIPQNPDFVPRRQMHSQINTVNNFWMTTHKQRISANYHIKFWLQNWMVTTIPF